MARFKDRDQIPLYTADNELREWISPQRATRLESLGLVRVVRHKRGHVNRCILQRRASDPRPTLPTAYMSTPFFYLERLDSGRRLWALRKLREGEGLAAAVLQSITESSAHV